MSLSLVFIVAPPFVPGTNSRSFHRDWRVLLFKLLSQIHRSAHPLRPSGVLLLTHGEAHIRQHPGQYFCLTSVCETSTPPGASQVSHACLAISITAEAPMQPPQIDLPLPPLDRNSCRCNARSLLTAIQLADVL